MVRNHCFLKKIGLFVTVSSFFLWGGCSTSKEVGSQTNLQVIEAIFKEWSEPPARGSDVPERGTDISITVKNWPEGYTPSYVVYDQKKSFAASVTDTSGSIVTIEARIIRMTARLNERSATTPVSDRLVFIHADGRTGFLEVNSWQRAK